MRGRRFGCLFGVMAVQVVLLGLVQSTMGDSSYYVDPAARITLADSADNESCGGLDGGMAVWYNLTNGMIYVRDLADPGSTARAIETAGKPSHARISGNYVVWYDYASYHVYACDISQPSPTPVQLTSAPSSENMIPDISGNMVIWKDDRVAGDADIWGYDLSDPNRGDFLLVEGLNAPMPYLGRPFPSISGDWLVWYQESDDMFLEEPWPTNTIMALDLSDPAATPFMLDAGFAVGIPRIDGEMVVYNISRGTNNWDVYGFDLGDIAAGPFPISVTDNNELAGDVSGNIAIYKYTEDHETIRAVDVTDIAAGEFTISGDEIIGHDYMAISGEWILWREGMDIYANRIVPEPATMSLMALGGLAVVRRRRRR